MSEAPKRANKIDENIMYKCIVIDDEIHAIHTLKQYIEYFPKLDLVESYTDSLDALMGLSQTAPVDLVFMDIEMPKINGIELSKQIRSKTNKLVFTTGHSKYGYEAFKVNADDYLLKPFSLSEFIESIHRLFPETGETKPKARKQDFFFVKSKDDNHKIVNIKFADVIAIESKLNYVMIYTKTKNILTYMALSEIAKLFEDHPGFAQFQRSFLIAKDYIEYIDGNSIRMTNGLEITVGEYYRKNFSEFVLQNLIKTGRK